MKKINRFTARFSGFLFFKAALKRPCPFLVICIFGLFLQAIPIFASPANPRPYEFRQPDGTAITLHVRGDEWFHWYETTDGRPVSLDTASGYWVYLRPSPPGTNILSAERVGLGQPQDSAWQPRPSQAQLKMDHGYRSVFSTTTNLNIRSKIVLGTGNAFVPVIFADFSDTNHIVSSVTMSNTLFNTNTGALSMSTYYSEVSYGKFTVSSGPSGVQDWVALTKPAAYYAPNISTPTYDPPSTNKNNGSRAAQFVWDAVRAAMAAGYKFAPYDQAGTGKVPVVNVVHAGLGQEDFGGPNAIWSHKAKLSWYTNLGSITADGGVVIDDYVIEPELQQAGTSNAPCTIGVFCHEFGHALGLPDLYDTDGSSFGVGFWSVMGYGSQNKISRTGDCPAHFDAWCKMRLGWVNPINYTLNSQNVTFPCAASNAFAAMLWKDGRVDKQYYLVENRYRAGFDQALPANGMLIWHIDDNKDDPINNTDNTREWYPISVGALPPNTINGNFHVALVQADNLWQLETAQSYGNTGDPFPGSFTNNRVFGPNTAPGSYAYNVGLTPGYDSFVTVSNISNPGPVMTADLYTRSPNSGPSVNWVNIAGVVPPFSGAQFVQLDDRHPVVVHAYPGVSGTALSQVQLYLNRSLDGRWWNFSSQQWETNASSSNYNVTSAQQYGLTLTFEGGLPSGTNLLNGGYVFTIRVIDTSSVVTEIQMAMTAAHAPEVNLSLADNSVVNTLTNFTAIATENSGLGVQRIEIALYWVGGASDGGEAVRWYWDGYTWTLTPQWLGADFPGHPPQATLYYPIGPDASSLETEKQYFIAARAVDALGDAATNTISVFYDPGTPATIYWRYSASGNWFDAANWTPSRVPLTTDHVVVNVSGDYAVTINGAANIASLRFGRVVGLYQQNLAVPAGTSLTIGGTDTNKIYANGTLDLAGNCSAGIVQFSGGAIWNWTGGTIVSGDYRVPYGAEFNISGNNDKTLAQRSGLTIAGSTLWTGSGKIKAAFTSVVTNDGTFTVQNDSSYLNSSDGYSQSLPLPLFVNNGNLVKNITTGATVFDFNFGGVAFNNNGTVNVQSGRLALGGGGTSANDSFTAAAGSVIDFNGGAFFFNGNLALSGAGTNRVSGGAVTFNNGTNTMGGANTFEIASGSVNGTNTVAGAGTVNWSGGTIAARLNLQAGIGFNISGDNDKTLAQRSGLTIAGSTLWTGSGKIKAAFTSVVTNDGTFTVQNDSSYLNSSDGYSQSLPLPLFVNNGNLVKNITTGATVFDFNFGGVAFNNNGTVNIQSGVISLGGGGAGSNGIFTAAFGSHIDLFAGGHSLTGNLTFSGAGSTRVNGGALTFGNSLSTMTAGGTFEVMSGSAGGTNTFAGTGNFNWSGGTIAARLNLQANIGLNISGNNDKTLAQRSGLTIAGSTLWTGSGKIKAAFTSVVTNDGTFTVQNDSSYLNSSDGYSQSLPLPLFVNNGNLVKNITTGATVFDSNYGGVAFNQNGTVDLQTGSLAINGGYTLSGSPQLKLVLGGINPGTQFSREIFAGSATLGGILSVTLANGFSPTNGQSFAIATYASSTGQFSSTQFPPLPVELMWKLTYAASSLLLQVVPSNVFQTSSLTNGNFQFTFVGETGSSCLIEASTNLFNWAPLFTNAPFNGLLNYVDPQTPQFPKRFYRATIFP